MKNRKLTILIVLVVGVWGTIGYKIYDGLDEETIEYASIPRKFAADTVYRERYDLALSYDDPFLKKKREQKGSELKATVAKKKVTPKVVVPQVVIDWSRIKYQGSVDNSSRKKVTAMIRIGEGDHLMKEGDLVEGFHLVEIRRDSVKFMFGKQSKYIKRDKL